MNIKFYLILLISLLTSSFHVNATVCNGGFENGHTCWSNLTEGFGFSEIETSYTDANSTIYTSTEGSFFFNFWGNDDLFQSVSWKKGDILSFDYTQTIATTSPNEGVSLIVGLTNGPEVTKTISDGLPAIKAGSGQFETFSYTFLEDSTDDSGLFFQASDRFPLEFDFDNPNEIEHILLDNVQISGVPLPGGVLFMATALLLLYSSSRIWLTKEQSNSFASKYVSI